MNDDLYQKIDVFANTLKYGEAIRELGSRLITAHQNGDPVPMLMEIMLCKDEWASLEARKFLTELKDKRAVPALIKALDHETWQKPFEDYIEEARAAGRTTAIIKMTEHVGMSIFELRSGAAYALGELGDSQAVPHLIKAAAQGSDDSVKHKDQDVKYAAAVALAKLGAPEAGPYLIEILADSEAPYNTETSNSYVAGWLKKIGTPEALNAVTAWEANRK